MMEIRIAWEPENLTPLDVFEARLTEYVKDTGGVTLLRNGTMLFIKGGENDEADARKVMQEAKFFTSFSVKEMKKGGYYVVFHDAVAVFVSAEEFQAMRSTIISRIEDLKLPGEQVLNPNHSPHDHYLIGLYGRGKLYRDVFDFHFFKRLDKLEASSN